MSHAKERFTQKNKRLSQETKLGIEGRTGVEPVTSGRQYEATYRGHGLQSYTLPLSYRPILLNFEIEYHITICQISIVRPGRLRHVDVRDDAYCVFFCLCAGSLARSLGCLTNRLARNTTVALSLTSARAAA